MGSDLLNGLGSAPEPQGPDRWQRLKRLVLGKPRDLGDTSIHRRLSLVALLAWVGLGADGLSSSSYGPDEAFRTLGQHTYLAVGAGRPHRVHRVRHRRGLQPHHRGVPARRRRLRRRLQAARRARRRGLRLRPAGRLRADHRGVDRRRRRRPVQLPAAALARREARRPRSLRDRGPGRAEHPRRPRVGDGPDAGVPGVPADPPRR